MNSLKLLISPRIFKQHFFHSHSAYGRIENWVLENLWEKNNQKLFVIHMVGVLMHFQKKCFEYKFLFIFV